MSDDNEKFYRADWMTDEQWACANMLADLFGGFHHLQRPPKKWGRGICLDTSFGCFASFDYDDLTRAVFLAHDRAIRFEIAPSGPRMLKLCLHYRGRRDGTMMERHPTLEGAVGKWRLTHNV